MDLTGKRLAVRPDVLVREIRGESVLLDLASESYFGLDEIGTDMWRALTSCASIQAALESLQREYEVTPDELRDDVTAFVEKLSRAGLVDVRDA